LFISVKSYSCALYIKLLWAVCTCSSLFCFCHFYKIVLFINFSKLWCEHCVLLAWLSSFLPSFFLFLSPVISSFPSPSSDLFHSMISGSINIVTNSRISQNGSIMFQCGYTAYSLHTSGDETYIWGILHTNDNRYIPRSKINFSHCSFRFDVLRKCHAGFHNCCTNLHSHQHISLLLTFWWILLSWVFW
jgi:hypothetical protein